MFNHFKKNALAGGNSLDLDANGAKEVDLAKEFKIYSDPFLTDEVNVGEISGDPEMIFDVLYIGLSEGITELTVDTSCSKSVMLGLKFIERASSAG